jgi:alkanesulfonate monooxygenase SsuD/methylene tetrahydromethanopterin reductase-like flavin-dependent oxidoreductase (luciferase family)
MDVGLTLPNRGVMFGVTNIDTMLSMAEQADRSDQFSAIWVGDSLLGKPRPESMTFMASIAARTRRVSIGPACMASFPLRDPVMLAYQWATLDLISGGRTILAACTGLVTQPGAKVEGALYGLDRKDRVTRMIEWIKILRLLWTDDEVSFQGEHFSFDGVSVDPKPVAKPHPPIWMASNAIGKRELVDRTLRRAAIHADGWQTSLRDLEGLKWRIAELKQQVADAGKDPDTYPICIYHNININEDHRSALEESRKFLELYYAPVKFSDKDLEDWCALGSPDECIDHLVQLGELGATHICLRITSWDQVAQFKRLNEEVLPKLPRQY